MLVCATTGIAANLIEGSTVDSLLKLRRGKGRYKESDELQRGDNSSDYTSIIDNIWMIYNFLILDEVSMLDCVKLTSISKTLEKNKSKTNRVKIRKLFQMLIVIRVNAVDINVAPAVRVPLS